MNALMRGGQLSICEIHALIMRFNDFMEMNGSAEVFANFIDFLGYFLTLMAF